MSAVPMVCASQLEAPYAITFGLSSWGFSQTAVPVAVLGPGETSTIRMTESRVAV